jgi:hypothetical protein
LLEEVIKRLQRYTFIFIRHPTTTSDIYVSKKNELPDGEFVETHWNNIKRMPNVHITTSLQQDLFRTVSRANVGIIPYVMKYAFNKYSHPIKLYLYFAMGIPVVSTPIRSVLPYKSEVVAIAKNAEEFIENIERMNTVTVSDTVRKQYITYALQHSFEQKAKDIIHVIDMYLCTTRT